MLSVHLEGGRVEVQEIPIPPRPSGFALIKLLLGGICNTDLELQRGYYGFEGTPGHEFAGVVTEADSEEWIGRRVVGEINLACGACAMCHRGLGRHCGARTVLGIVRHPGAFQEYFTLPERNLHAIPEEVSLECAVFVEPLAAACEVLDQVRIPHGAAVAVLGMGKLGRLIARVLLTNGCRVEEFGRNREKPAAEFDWVVDATGSPEGLQQAVRMTRPRGTVIMKSTTHGLTPIDAAGIIVNEITLVGSRCGRFEPALELLRSGRVKVDDMISARMPLAMAPQAFERAAEKGVLKVLLTS
jgi:alcohol dehydrogenase